MISFEDVPQSIKDNVTDIQFPDDAINDAMEVSFKNGLEASVITGPGTYGGKAGLYEVAVGFVGSGMIWDECPLTGKGGVTGWLTAEDVVEWLGKVAEFDSSELAEAREAMEIQAIQALAIVTQFGILRLAGITPEDDPFVFLDADQDTQLDLGLDWATIQALKAVTSLANQRVSELKAENAHAKLEAEAQAVVDADAELDALDQETEEEFNARLDKFLDETLDFPESDK